MRRLDDYAITVVGAAIGLGFAAVLFAFAYHIIVVGFGP